MKQVLLLCYCLLAVAPLAVSAQTTFPEFSPLSSRPLTAGFSYSLKIDGGLLFYTRFDQLQNVIYKVSDSGQLLDSLLLSIDGYVYTGSLTRDGANIYLVGQRVQLGLPTLQEAAASFRRTILTLNSDLDVVALQVYDNVLPLSPPNVLGWQLATQVNNSARMMPVDGTFCHNDTCWLAREYALLDTADYQPVSVELQMEKLGLDGTVYTVADLDPYVGAIFNSAIFTSQRMFVFGWMNPNPPLSIAAVGEFDLAGNFITTHALDQANGGGVDNAALNLANGAVHNNDIWLTYYAQSSVAPGGCNGASAVLERRNADFDLIQRVKVPDCGQYPGGRNCLAFGADGSILYQTQRSGNITVHRYDPTLALVWSKVLDFSSPHLAISLNEMPDGGCLVEALAIENNVPFWKLYRLDAEGDLVSEITRPAPAALSAAPLFPNPSKGLFYLPEAAAEHCTEVEISDANGRQFGRFSVQNGAVDLRSLPAGVYGVQLLNRSSGAPYAAQWVVKMAD